MPKKTGKQDKELELFRKQAAKYTASLAKNQNSEEKATKTKNEQYFEVDQAVRDLVNDHLSDLPTIPNLDVAMYATALNMYLRGVSQNKIVQYVGCPANTIKTWSKQGWDDLRERLFSRVSLDIFEQIQSEEVKHSKEMIKKLRPITNRLSTRALAAADSPSLDAKDILTQAREYIRLTGQFSGELQENKNISVGPNQVWTAVMDKVSGKDVDRIKEELPEELTAEVKLIE